MSTETFGPRADFTQIAKQLFALAVQARRISAMIGGLPDKGDEAEAKPVKAA